MKNILKIIYIDQKQKKIYLLLLKMAHYPRPHFLITGHGGRPMELVAELTLLPLTNFGQIGILKLASQIMMETVLEY